MSTIYDRWTWVDEVFVTVGLESGRGWSNCNRFLLFPQKKIPHEPQTTILLIPCAHTTSILNRCVIWSHYSFGCLSACKNLSSIALWFVKTRELKCMMLRIFLICKIDKRTGGINVSLWTTGGFIHRHYLQVFVAFCFIYICGFLFLLYF